MAHTSTLPLVYQNHFKNAAKQYDNKEFKKAVASVDKILDKYPDHPDSLALKGLLMKALKPEDMDECYSYIKLALKYSDNKSFMAWNVYGTLKKEDNDFATAQKCFANALKLDPNNLSVAVDLAYTQAQTRDFKSLVQTRNLLLQQKPQYWFYWTGAIVANHLAKNYQVALSLIDTFLKQYDNGVVNGSNHAMSKYELSELLLYKAQILIEMGDYKQALKFLNIVEPFIKDRVSHLEFKGKCLLQLKKKDDAKKIYRELLVLNCENYEYWAKFQETHDLHPSTDDDSSLSDDDRSKLFQFYDNMKTEFPNSNVLKRIPLNFMQEDLFEKTVDEFVRPFLHSNVPSLFSNMKSLYKNQNKVQIIERVMLQILSSLESNNQFPNTSKLEPPTTLLWTYLYMAYHYDKLHQLETALEYVNKAIEHTPTAIELYMCKARILKHAGDANSAAEQMDLARKMDLADRYLNTKAVKYLNRADRIVDAENILFLFAKDQEGKFNVVDMQAMQYEIEVGYSYMRQNKLGRALKWFSHVVDHFQEIRSDQYDFHSYCLRKYMMRPYCDMLTYMDTLENHPYYYSAVTGMVKTYLLLYKNAELRNPEKNATESDLHEYESRVSAASDKGNKVGGMKYKKDPKSDPFGNKLLLSDGTALLNEADKYMKVLNEFCGDRVETHLLAAELYLAAERYLHGLKSLKEARKMNPNHPQLHFLTCQLFHAINSGKVVESMARLIKMQQSQLMDQITDINEFNEQYLKNKETTDKSQLLAQVLAYTKVGYQVLEKTGERDQYVQLLLSSADSSTPLSDVMATYEYLKSSFSESELASFKSKAAQLYPQCTVLKN